MRWWKTWGRFGVHHAGSEQRVRGPHRRMAHLAAGLAHYHGEVAWQCVGCVVEGDVERLDVGGRPERTLTVKFRRGCVVRYQRTHEG